MYSARSKFVKEAKCEELKDGNNLLHLKIVNNSEKTFHVCLSWLYIETSKVWIIGSVILDVSVSVCYTTSSENHGQSFIRLLTVGQLVELFSISWIICAMFLLVPSHFLITNAPFNNSRLLEHDRHSKN